MSTYQEYSLDAEIAEFFTQTSATRESCDAMAKGLIGGSVVPVTVQGYCSYTVYAGPELEFVVQFRLKSLMLEPQIPIMAREIYGSLAPSVSFHGPLGDNSKEPLFVYVMSRMRGVSYLDFILANNDTSRNSDQNRVWRKTLMADVARYVSSFVFPYLVGDCEDYESKLYKWPPQRYIIQWRVLSDYSFFALSWKAPQEVDSDYCENLRQKYTKELRILLISLPPRFHPATQKCLDSMEAIMSLPMVLLHHDFSSCNYLVDETSCHLTGVIDWAEAEVEPFGLNLESLQSLRGTLHLKNGWTRFEDYDALHDTFWKTFRDEVGDLSTETMETIKSATIMGLLLSHGFTIRLANKPQPIPICDDEVGRYNMLSLDNFLLNPDTRFDDLN